MKRGLSLYAAAAFAFLYLPLIVLVVFTFNLGAYLTPDLLGGRKTVMVGNLIQDQFTTARDWPFGSAVSLVLMLIATLLLVALLRRSGEDVL